MNYCEYYSSYTTHTFEPTDDHEEHLHETLGAYLAQRHPEKPADVVQFLATRLVSHDRPVGHGGDWFPLNEGDGCVLRRCCGTQGCAALEARVEWMTAIALRAWHLVTPAYGY